MNKVALNISSRELLVKCRAFGIYLNVGHGKFVLDIGIWLMKDGWLWRLPIYYKYGTKIHG